MGNILKDVYLNLDFRTEKLETDHRGAEWLNLCFDASSHRFFHRDSSFGGAAVSLEVLQQLGLDARISDSHLDFSSDDRSVPASNYRYVLVSETGVSYLTPTDPAPTVFKSPAEAVDYLFIDRSAVLSTPLINQILAYLDLSPKTKLVCYLKDPENRDLKPLIQRASLIFAECESKPTITNLTADFRHVPTGSYAGSTPVFSATSDAPKSPMLDPAKTIFLSEQFLTYQNLSEPLHPDRIDTQTHLSFYSILSATVLGCFLLGFSVEDSLKFAHLNAEHSRLNAVCPLAKLRQLASEPTDDENLELIAKNLVLNPRGILAADESGGSIHKKFESLSIPDTYDNRRDYRNLFFTTNNLENYVNGVILFDETARQLADNGQNFIDFLTAKRIIPGIKVDQGLEKFADSLPPELSELGLSKTSVDPDETWTKGLTGLDARLAEYYQMGLRFAKWRAAFNVRTAQADDTSAQDSSSTTDNSGLTSAPAATDKILTPTPSAIAVSCQILAKYAKKCQNHGIVPIVEPELVYDGNYSLAQSAKLTGKILDCLFEKLSLVQVNLRACILKVNMCLAGKQWSEPSTPEEVGRATAEILKNHVPTELAGVVFLSGGQTVEQATDNLAAVEQNGPFPWPVTFSFARALQDPALYAWAGDNANADTARTAFKARLEANCQALAQN